MFSLTSLKALKGATCPELTTCKRDPCLYSHESSKPPPPQRPPSAGNSSTVRAEAGPSSSDAAVKRALPPLDKFSRPTKVQKPNPPSQTGTSTFNAATHLKLQPQSAGSHTPFEARSNILKLYFDAYQVLYAQLPDPPNAKASLAAEHASGQEAAVYKASNKYTYKNMAAQALTRLKKLPKPTTRTQTGTLEDIDQRRATAAKMRAASLDKQRLAQLTLTNFDMTVWGKDFVTQIPEGDPLKGQTEEGAVRDCSRCKKGFFVKPVLEDAEKRECEHHWGRLFMDSSGGTKQRIWSCCRTPPSPPIPCSLGPHVFAETDAASLHARHAFRSTKDICTTATPLPVAALDCELVYTTAGISLARVTVVSDARAVVFDSHVRPAPASLLDTNFRFSGINPEDLATAKHDLPGVQAALGEIIGPKTILIGHGIENDLKALRLVHPFESLVDTSVLFPHPAGPPRRLGLRALAKQHLGQFIQDTGSHDSKDDSLATLDLVRFKLSKMQ